MSVRIEFYGLCRQRAGAESIDVEAAALGEALERAAEQLPSFAESCLADGRLRDGYLANVNGEFFTRDAKTPLIPGDAVLILSADAGG